MLGALRYMGRGWTFDDLEEGTQIGEDKHRTFFHTFIKVGATKMYDKWVKQPCTDAEIDDCLSEFREAGMDGSCFSTDATHVQHEKCDSKLKNAHLGGKMPCTARSYNISVNHRREILATAPGCPGRWNDKTVSTFDRFLCDVRQGKLYEDVTYDLYDSKGTLHTFRGVWGLADNGYLKWSCLMPPVKDAVFEDDLRWSKWLESMRKDVECTFGILKGRWRILKVGIRLHSISDVDRVWKTCCALHNFLLHSDGLNIRWKKARRRAGQSDYEGELGLHDLVDSQRLHVTGDYDTSGMRLAEAEIEDEERGEDFHEVWDDEIVDAEAGGGLEDINVVAIANAPLANVTDIRNLGFDEFRKILIAHFNYRFRHMNDIKWPSRTGEGRPLQWWSERHSNNDTC